MELSDAAKRKIEEAKNGSGEETTSSTPESTLSPDVLGMIAQAKQSRPKKGSSTASNDVTDIDYDKIKRGRQEYENYKERKSGKVPISIDEQKTFMDVMDSSDKPNLADDATLGAHIAKAIWYYGYYSGGTNADTSLPNYGISQVTSEKLENPEKALEIGKLSKEDRNTFYSMFVDSQTNAIDWATEQIANTESQQAEKVQEWAKENPILGNIASLAPLQAAGSDYLNVLTDAYAGTEFYNPNDINNPSAFMETARAGAKEGSLFGTSAVGQFFDDVVYSSIQSEWSNLLSGGKAAGPFSSLPLALYSASSTARQMLLEGHSREEAAMSATTHGVISFITEAIGSDWLIDKAYKNTRLGEPMKAFVKRVGSMMLRGFLGEGSEEIIESLSNLLVDNILDYVYDMDTNEFSKLKAEELAKGKSESQAAASAAWRYVLQLGLEGLAGGLSGGLMAGGSMVAGQIAQDVGNTKAASKFKSDASRINLIENLKTVANSSGGTYADNLTTGGKGLKRLVENIKIGSAMSQANRDTLVSGIEERLLELGVPVETARSTAEAAFRSASEGTTTKAEDKLLATSQAQTVLQELEDGADWIGKVNYVNNVRYVPNDTDYSKIEGANDIPGDIETTDTTPTTTETAPASTEVSEKIAEYKKNAGIETEVDEVNDNDVLSSAAKAHGIDTTRVMESFQNRQNVMSAEAYANAIETAKAYGEAGLTLSEMVYRNGFATDNLLNDVYTKASENFKTRLKEDSARRVKSTAKFRYMTSEEAAKEGVTPVNMTTKFTAEQEAQMKVQQDVLAKAFNVNIAVFDGAGTNKNGWYDSKTNTLFVDINSMNGDRVYDMLGTTAHELVHSFRTSAPGTYIKLRQFIAEEVYGGENHFSDAVEQKMQQYKNAGHQLESKTEAVEEIMADSCAKVFDDGTLVRKLAQKDRGLFSQIKSWLADTLAKIKSFFTGKESNKYAEKLNVRQLERAMELFEEAAKEIAQNSEVGNSLSIETKTDVKVENMSISKEVDDILDKTDGDITDLPLGGMMQEGEDKPKKLSIKEAIFAAGLNPGVENRNGIDFLKVTTPDGTEITPDMSVKEIKSIIKNSKSTLNLLMDRSKKILGTMDNKTIDAIQDIYAEFLHTAVKYGNDPTDGKLKLDSIWKWAGTKMFRAIKPNSDKQYGVSNDLLTICKKTEQLLDSISDFQVRNHRGATPGEVMRLYYHTGEKGYQTPCPFCYVFSHWIRMGLLLETAASAESKYASHITNDGINDAEYWKKEWLFQKKWAKDNEKLIANAKGDIQDIPDIIDSFSKPYAAALKLMQDNAVNTAEYKKGAKISKEIESIVATLNERYVTAFNLVSTSDYAGWISSCILNIPSSNQIEIKEGATDEEKWAAQVEAASLYGDYKKVDQDVLFDLRRVDELVRDYPAMARFRTSKGSAGGKAVENYADNAMGEVVAGIATDGKQDAANALLDSFNSGDTKDIDSQLKSAAEKARKQLLRGGNRVFSWSDNRIDTGIDMLMNFIQFQAIGAGIQAYTKQLEGLELISGMNGYVNGSLIAKGVGYEDVTDSNGNTKRVLVFSDVQGINSATTFELNKRFDKAGNILVGMNDIHIRTALADDRIFFVIPWHRSGLSDHLLFKMMEMLGEKYVFEADTDSGATDYTSFQEEKTFADKGKLNGTALASSVPANVTKLWSSIESMKVNGKSASDIPGYDNISVKKGALSNSQIEYRKLRAKVMSGEELSFDEEVFVRGDYYLNRLKTSMQEHNISSWSGSDIDSIYPYEYWDYNSTYSTADINGLLYLEYCRRLGVLPKFCGINSKMKANGHGDFHLNQGYWKLLIDRRMYDTKGRYQHLEPVNILGTGKPTVPGFSMDLVTKEGTDRRKAEYAELGLDYSVTRAAEPKGAKIVADATMQDMSKYATLTRDTNGAKAKEKYSAMVNRKGLGEFFGEKNTYLNKTKNRMYRDLGIKEEGESDTSTKKYSFRDYFNEKSFNDLKDESPLIEALFETVYNAKSTFDGKYFQTLYSSNPELDYVVRFQNGDKTAVKEFKALLDKIDNVAVLDDLRWYAAEGHAKYVRSINNYSWGSIAGYVEFKKNHIKGLNKFRELIDARAEIVGDVGGTNLGIKKGARLTIDEVESYFNQLNNNKDFYEIGKKVFARAKKLGLEVVVTNAGADTNRSRLPYNEGYYNPEASHTTSKRGLIVYRLTPLNSTNITNSRKANILLHECIHACTSYADTANRWGTLASQNNELTKAVGVLGAMYGRLAKDAGVSAQYGLKNHKEFLAELSNPEFRQYLYTLDRLTKFDAEDYVDFLQAQGYLAGIDQNNKIASALDCILDKFLDNYDDNIYRAITSLVRVTPVEGQPKYSLKDSYAPTFYSHMSNVIGDIKQDKVGAASVVNYLKGKGVKDEEIKWSGIETFLEGKKSVTKQELQEFAAGSMLQIEEKTLSQYPNSTAKRYAQEHKALEQKLDDRVNRFNDEYVSKAEKWLKSAIPNNKNGVTDLTSYWRTERNDNYYNYYDRLVKQVQLILLNRRYNPDPQLAPKWMNSDLVKELKQMGEEAKSEWEEMRSIEDTLRPMDTSNWSRYKTDGGDNYQELLFKMPNSTHSNKAMSVHWGERSPHSNETGVLAHARMQDIETTDGKMLFIEEIQSDWHNAGQKNGYYDESINPDSLKHEFVRSDVGKSILTKLYAYQLADYDEEGIHITIPTNGISLHNREVMYDLLPLKIVDSLLEAEVNSNGQITFSKDEVDVATKLEKSIRTTGKTPDAPFKTTYTDYVLKRLLRIAAENGYSSIGWTTAKIQDERWDDNLPHKDGEGNSGNLKGYTIEYDQDMPKFLNKYGKKWGGKVDQTTLSSGDTVWRFTIPESMKQSVLYEGQPMYSLKAVAPVNPTSNVWARGADTQTAMQIYPNLWNVAADTSEKRNPTQITTTVSTYRKIYGILKSEGFDGKILDASSGRGYGTKAGIEEFGFKVDDIEPYPGNDYSPKYEDYSTLNNKYDVIISNAVLNVLPQDQRDALVVKMGELLNNGGRMFINVRSLSEIQALQEAVDKKTGKPKNVTISASEVAETTHGSYQKGFTKAELKAYLEDALGDGYTVAPTDKFGGTSVIVTKNSDGNKYSLKDSDGKTLSQGQQEFFKNSKVRDRNGRLKKVYHSTNASFTKFDISFASPGSYGLGFYFTPEEEYSKDYGKNTAAYYLNIKKPFEYYAVKKEEMIDIIDNSGYDYDKEFVENYDFSQVEEWGDLINDFLYDAFPNYNIYDIFSEILKKSGYDGIDVGNEEIVAFYPNQIKLTTNLNPTENEDIRYSIKDIESAWSRDTSYGNYSEDNPSAGQCAVTALYLNQTYGYKLYDVMVGRTRHFFNKDASGNVVDLTAQQFKGKTISYESARERNPKDLLTNTSFMQRYNTFKSRVDGGNEGSRYSIKGYNKTAYLEENRVDRYLSSYAVEDDPSNSQAWIAMMDLKKFIPATTSSFTETARIQEETGPLNVDNLKNEKQPMFFDVKLDDNGKPFKITSHEGRHRATALIREGIERAPVILFDYGHWKNDRKSFGSLLLSGQSFGTEAFFVLDAIPLDYAHRDEIISKYSTVSQDNDPSSWYGELRGRETLKYSYKERAYEIASDVEKYPKNYTLTREGDGDYSNGGFITPSGKALGFNHSSGTHSEIEKRLAEMGESLYYKDPDEISVEDGCRTLWDAGWSQYKQEVNCILINRVTEDNIDTIKDFVEYWFIDRGKRSLLVNLGDERFQKFEKSSTVVDDVMEYISQKSIVKYSYKEDLNAREYLASAVLDNIRDEDDKATLKDYIETYNEQKETFATIDELKAALESGTVNAEEVQEQINELRAKVRERESKLNSVLTNPRMLSVIKQQRETIEEFKWELQAEADKVLAEQMANGREKATLERRILAERVKSNKKLNDLKAKMNDRLAAELLRKQVEISNIRAKNRESKGIAFYRPRIEKLVKELTVNLKSTPEIFRNTFADFLKGLELETRDPYTGVVKATASNWNKDQLYKSLLKISTTDLDAETWFNQYGIDINPEMVEWVQEIKDQFEMTEYLNPKGVNIPASSAEELHMIYKILRSLNTTAKMLTRAYTNKALDMTALAKESQAYIGTLGEYEQGNKVKEGVYKFFDWSMAQPATVFDRAGDGGRKIFKLLQKGQAKAAFNDQVIADFIDGKWTKAEARRWSTDVVNIKLTNGSVSMTPAQMMTFYCTAKDKDGYRHLVEGGGFKLAELHKDTGKKTVDTARRINDLDVASIEAALASYDPRLIQLSNEIQQFIEKVGSQWGNQVSIQRFGIEQFGIENYFPLHTVAADKEGNITEQQDGERSFYGMLNRSFTKERKFKANNAVVIDNIFDVFADHMSKMSVYNAFALPVLDTARWMNYSVTTRDAKNKPVLTTLGDSMNKAFGRGVMQGYIRNLLTGLNGTHMSEETSWALTTLRLHNRVAVAANIRVAVQQPFSIVRAYDELPMKYFTPVKDMKGTYAELIEHSGIGLWKDQGHYDVNIKGSLLTDMKGEGNAYGDFVDEVSEKSMVLAELGDKFTWTIIWNACKNYVNQTNPGLTGDDFYNAVDEKFSDIIYRTQVVDTPLQKSDWMRKKDDFLHRMTSSFKAEPTTTYNMLLRAYDKFQYAKRQGDFKSAWAIAKGPITKAVGVFAAQAIVNALVTAIVDAMRDDDDYETLLEKLLSSFGDNLLDNINPFASLPWVADAIEILKGYSPDRVDLSAITNAVNIFKKVASAIKNDSWSYSTTFSLIDAASKLSGIPVANAMRDVVSVWNSTVGAVRSEFKVQQTPEKASSGYEALYKAVANGNTNRANEIVDEIASNKIDPEKAYTGTRNKIKEAYRAGKISEDEAVEYIMIIDGYFDIGRTRSSVEKLVSGW